MTADEIRSAISASPELQALLPDTVALAAHPTFSGYRSVQDYWLTDVGLIGQMMPTHGSSMVESILSKLKTMSQTSEIVEAARNKLRGGAGLNFGDPSTRAQIHALGQIPVGGFSVAEVAALLKLGERPAPVPEMDIRCAIYSDDGSLLV